MAQYAIDPNTGQRIKIEKSHRFRNFVVLPGLAVIALIVVISAATSSHSGSGTPAGNGPGAAPAASTGHVVQYQLDGSGQGMVTFTTDQNLSMSQATVNLPWSTQVTINSSFAPVSVSVFRGIDGGSGPLSCKIIVDGKTVSSNNSSGGDAASVSCNATL